MKEVPKKSTHQIALEWDDIAEKRYLQITEGKDLTYTQTLCPIFLNEATSINYDTVLDVGCGVGYLTHILSKKVGSVYGVDISQKSIDIAQKKHQAPNIEYTCKDILNVTLANADLCIANMFLMDCLELDKVLERLSCITRKSGKLLCTIPNPMIMPRYWGYEKYKWFNYQREIIIESEFQTSSQGTTGYKTTHVHRPISLYLELFSKYGFTMVTYKEISGNPLNGRVIKKYPRHLFLGFVKH